MITFAAELEKESAITGRVLARVPEEKLAWKPHPKSMTLGQLALHVASIPARLAEITATDTFLVDPARFGKAPQPENLAEIKKAFEESTAAGKTYLEALTDERFEAIWQVKAGDREVMAIPRKWALRSIMFNHLYHHRGQLSVYLRLLDIPVPTIYGASADESPFTSPD